MKMLSAPVQSKPGIEIGSTTQNLSSHHKQCQLLELPRELRDIVYEYALSFNGGLITDGATNGNSSQGHPLGRFFQASDQDRCDHNQLKFVCKLLFAETRGLGLRYNDLTFRGGLSHTGLEVLQFFVNIQCSSTHLSQIRKMIIVDPPLPGRTPPEFPKGLDSQTLSPLVAFAQTHPYINISIRLPHFNLHTPIAFWIIYGSVLQYALRGTIPFEPSPGDIATYRQYSTAVLGENFICPTNIHLYPIDFEEDKVKKEWSLNIGGVNNTTVIRQCRKWCEQGF